MDLNSTRTAANTITPVEKPKTYGDTLHDFFVENRSQFEPSGITPEGLAKKAYETHGASSGKDYDTWSNEVGLGDFVPRTQSRLAELKAKDEWEASKPAGRGFLAGTGAALGRGAMNVVSAVGQTLALADLTPNAIDTEKGYLDTMGEGMTKWAEDKKEKTQFMRPTMAEEADENSYVKKSWEGGVESIVTSATPIAAGFAGAKAGAAAGSAFGPVGMGIGGTIGGLGAYGLARFGMFGAGVYGDTYDKTYAELKQKNPGMAEDEVRRIANKGAWTDAISENVSEAVGDAAAFYTFGGTKILQQPLKATIKDVMKRGVKGVAGDVARQMPFEVGSEVANAAVGAHWRKEAGLDGGDMKAAMVDAIGPAIVMSLLMGGGVAGYTEVKARKALNDINAADPNVRAKTANEIALQISERTKDPELAETWRKEAFARIQSGDVIEIDEQLAKFGANKARIDAVDNGEDVAVIPDETEVAEAAKVDAPLSPAESLLTDGVKTTPVDVLMGTDAPPVVSEQETEDLDAEWNRRMSDRQVEADARALDAEWETRRRIQELDAEIKQLSTGRGKGTKKRLEAAQVAKQERKRLIDQLTQAGQNANTSAQVMAELPASSPAVGNIPVEAAQQVQAEAPDLNAEWSARADEQQVNAQGRMLDAEWSKRQAEMEERASVLRKRAENLTAPEGKKNSPAREAKLQEVQAELQQIEAAQLSPAPDSTVAPPSAVDEGAISAPEIKTELDAVANEAATSPLNDTPEPTQAQKEAGNYKKGHVRINGLDFSIENPKGSERKGVDKDGRAWSTTMRNHYAYIKGSVGADKDHVDAFLSDAPESGRVFIVDQVDPKTGAFDEHKAMVGFETEAQAREAYLSNYEQGWRGLGAITPMEHAEFKQWVFSKKTKKPVGDISKADQPSAETVTAPVQAEASPISEPPTLPADQRTQEQAAGMASPGQRPSFEDMVKDAARWRGAARNLAREVEGDKRAALRLSKTTTKGDLDAYLMRKYGIDEAEARNVSNHLTAQNVPDDMTATVEEFKDEPWAKEVRKERPESKSDQEPVAQKSQEKGDPRDKHFESLIRSKGAKDMGDGIYYFDEKFMTMARIQRLQTERDQKDVGKRVSRTDSFEFKHWSEVTGDRLARGYAILDRRARNAERANPAAPAATPVQEKAEAPAPKQDAATIAKEKAAARRAFVDRYEDKQARIMAGNIAMADIEMLKANFRAGVLSDQKLFAKILDAASEAGVITREERNEISMEILRFVKDLKKSTPKNEAHDRRVKRLSEIGHTGRQFWRELDEIAKEDKLSSDQKRQLEIDARAVISNAEMEANKKTPTPEWVKINRDKTVEANIPEAAKEKLTLKQQKEWLLAEIDKAMKSGVKGGKPFEFHVPNDGHFRVKPENLAAFKEAVVARFPEKERPSAIGKNPPRPAQSSKGRVAEGEYYNEWSDHNQPLEPALHKHKAGVNLPYWDTDLNVLVDGYILVQLDAKPNVKGLKSKGDKGVTASPIEDLMKSFDNTLNDDAELVGVFKSMGEDKKGEDTEANPVILAHVRNKFNGKDAIFDAKKVDAVRTIHPDATLKVDKDGAQLGFYKNGKLVGVVLGFTQAPEFTDYHKARMEEIAAKKEGRTPRVTAANTEVEASFTKDEQDGVDLLVGLAKGEAPKQDAGQEKPVTGRTRWFVDYSETNKDRTSEVKSFATLAEAREFAKGKSGYISKQEDMGSGLSTDQATNTFKEYFGGFDPSAQEGQKMKSAFGEVPAVKKQEEKAEAPARKSDNRTFRSIDTLNALIKPVEHEDWFKFPDGSEWQAKQGYTARGWTLVRDGKAHPTIQSIEGQVELVGAIVQQQDALKTEKAKPEDAGTADAGQELTYNKRNRVNRGLSWSDLKDMNPTLRTKEAVKAKIIPKPDYQAMIDDGTHPAIVHIFKQVYDFIAARPRPISRTQTEDEAIQLYIDSANRVMDEARKWATDGRGAEWVKSMGELMLARSGKGPISISELRQKGQAAGPYEALYPNGWSAARDEINALGSNRYLRGIQMGEDELVKALKDIDKGWPGTVPAWKKQGYSIVKIGEMKPTFYVGEDHKKQPYVYVHFSEGRNSAESVLVRGTTSATDTRVLEAVAQGRKMYDGKFALLSKGRKVVSAHDTEADAIAAAEAVTKKKAGAGGIKEEGYSVEASSRTGVEHRMNGEDVTTEQLMKTFGFKGVNFGNWMKGKGNEAERQMHINMAYDSFMDLAQILNVPPKAISLNGLLGLAIGAQGTGSAAAHFVPGVNEINLTRTGGAGAVAHEWAHGLDHYFANIAGLSRSTEPFVTEHTRSSNAAIGEMRPEVMERFAEIVKAMTRVPMSRAEVEAQIDSRKSVYVRNIDSWLKSMRRSYLHGITDALMINKNGKQVNFAEEFDRIAERIKIGDVEDGKISLGRTTFVSPVVAELRDLYMLKKVGNQKTRAYSIEDFKALQANVDSLLYYNSERAQDKAHEPQMRGSDYGNASAKKDKDKSGKRYWSTKLEMFARAFAGYVYDRLDAVNAKNTYLVRPDSADSTEQTAYAPIGEERKRINAAFDALLKELKTKETDKGVALYQTATSIPTAVDIRAAFPWADSIINRDGKTIVTKGKVSFAIEQVERIDADNVAFQAGYGRGVGAGEEIAGAYLQGKSTIRLSRVADQWTVAHEYEHFLEDMGLITKFEQAVLDAAVKKAEKDGTLAFDPGQGQSRMKPAELRAYYVQHALIARDFQRKTTLGRVLQKVADFVDALVNLAVRTSRGVVRDVASGKMMGRESLKADVADGMRGFQTKDVTETEAFKKWFGKSKVVDKDGKPLVVYHGTAASFDVFADGNNRQGFYFAESPEYADLFAEGPGANIIPAYVSIKKPADMTEGISSDLFRALSDAGYSRVGDILAYKPDDYWELFDGESELKDALSSLGFDGVKLTEPPHKGKRYPSWLAFEPTQIKSATGNSGAFDPADARIQYAMAPTIQKAREFKDDLLTRPEVFGPLNFINTQLHKALKQPAFRRIFDRFHAAAGTQQRAAARAASLAPDILPDHSGNFKQSVRELFTKTRDFSIEDLKHVSRVMSMETLSGKDASPFSGHRLTDDELTRLEAGETITVGGNEIRMNAKQMKLYRQSRAALDQMLTEMATSEAWRIIRGVLTKHQSAAGEFDARDYWEVFADQPNEASAAMQDMLQRELEKGQARLTQAEMNAHAIAGADDMDGFKAYGKTLTKLNKAIDNKEKFSKKQLEDGDLDEIIAKREERIEKLAGELGIDASDAEERLKEYKAALKEYNDASQHVENVNGAFKQIADVFKKSEQLIKAGYAPLSRFGQYRIDVHNDAGELIHVSFYDTSTEAARERRSLVTAFDGYDGGAVVGAVETVSQEDWKQFQGANPEALRMFAQKAGADSEEVMQAYYQNAIASRSALKRLINRKGYAGYSEDLQRIMASFITSGSKRIGQNYHAADIAEMVDDRTLPADLRDEARKLKAFIDNPGDAGSGFRSFAANWYMLGSFMSAAWNGTQVFTSTVPELYKHGGSIKGATGEVLKAYRSLIRKGSDLSPTEKIALRRAMEDGTVDAAEIHHLYAQATKRFINKLGDGEAAKRVGAFLRLWGMPFSWFEVVNRKASFIAAYRMGEAQGVDDVYAFAKQIVDITQGIYAKHNRMNMARGAVMGSVMTFMQYKIMTLEQIARNAKEGGQARKAAALQLAIIAAMGGWKALPGIEDITDLYDTIMQTIFGKAVLSKKAMSEAVKQKSVEVAGLILEKESAGAVGKFFADMVNNGIVTATLPVDVSGKAAMGSLIPGLKLLKPSTQYRDGVVFDMAGVPGSMLDSLIDASGMILQGDMGRAAMRLAPNAVAAVAKGVDIGLTGEIRNTRGKKIADGTPLNAAVQALGGQPREKTRISNRLRENQELKFLTQSTEKSIVSEWADAYEKKGVVAQREALLAVRKRIADWNSANPDWPIVVKQSQVMNELKNRKRTTVQLASKSAPKELRQSMAVE